jgi:ABC-type sugar transport system substrate-binding protein
MQRVEAPALPGRFLRVAVLVALAAVALVFAACGGDDSNSGGSGGGGGGGSADTSAADQLSKQASTRPTKITQTKPVGKEIPTGKKITFISCGVEACAVQGPILAEGAKMLGWSVKQVGTDGSPEKVQGAFQAAIRDGADGVIINAADKDALASQLQAAKKAGVEFATCCSLAQQGTDVMFNIGSPEQNAPIGEMLAAKVVEDSGGKANALYVNVSAFAILATVNKTFESKMKELCSDCKTATIDVPLTSLGKDAPDRIVSYLRSHPDTNYVVLSESGSLGPGLTGALRAAGLSDKVKIVGQGGNESVYQEVAAGDWLAVVPSALYSYDYGMLDAFARKFAGVPVEETSPEFWLMDKANVPSGINGPAFPIVTDYKAQWAKLWGKDAS